MARRRSSTKPKSSSGGGPDISGIEDRIKPVQSLPLIVSMVGYGRSGTGKTTFASTWPKPLLLLDIKDEGTDSIKDVEGVDVLSIESWEDIEKAYWYIQANKKKYKSVVIDTVTQLQEKCLAHVLASEGKEFPTQQIWGKTSGLMKTSLMDFRDLQDEGINICFLAQDRLTETETDDDEEIDPEVGPRLMPSLASQIMASVKVIGNTFIKEKVTRSKDGKIKRSVDYRMRLGPHAFYNTKIRKPKSVTAPESIANPDFKTITDIMKGTIPKESTASTKKKKRTKKS